MNEEMRSFEITIFEKMLSVNKLYMVPKGRRHRILTDEGRKWKKRVHKKALGKISPDKPLSGPITVTIVYHFNRQHRSEGLEGLAYPDVSNYDKPLLDALGEVVWEDDKQIRSLHLHKEVAESKEDERYEIFAKEVDLI